MREKRSLFQSIFGRPKNFAGQTLFRMLNGYSPTFTNFSGDAYDSDVVRAAVDSIARNAAKLKPKHIRRVDEGIQNTGSNIEKLLSVRPNKYMNAYSFYYKVVTSLMMQNNAFIYIDWDAVGGVRGFYPVNASTVEFVESKSMPGVLLARFLFLGGQTVTLPYENLIHLRRFFYKQDLWGEINDKALTPTLQLIKTTDEGIANAVKSSAYLRGLLKFTSTMLKPEDLKQQRDNFVEDYMDVNNNGGIAALDAKADYVPLDNDPKMIDSKQMELIEKKVYKFFGVNEKIVMSTYNEDEWNAFYESIIEPLAIQMSLEFTSKLFTSREQGHGNEIIYEANRLQYASTETKLKTVEILVDRGLMNKNEGREIFNMGPIEDGEKYIVSLNFIQADKANQYQVGDKTKTEEGAPNNDDGPEA